MRSYRFLILLLLLSSCAPRPIYIVNVVQSSEGSPPYWLSHHSSGMFIGVGEAPSMEAANRAALNDLMVKLSQEIGVELNASSGTGISEAGGELSQSSYQQIDIFSGSLLRDVLARVTTSYWEHCRAQTGRKQFNDFYRFFILAEVSSLYIDSLRARTVAENDLRLANLQQSFSRLAELEADPKHISIPACLDELTVALQTASTLYYQRKQRFDEVGNRMIASIRALKLEVLEPYSEVRPERHYYRYRATQDGKPASGLKLRFGLTQGWGNIVDRAVTDDDGIAVCDVYRMESQQPDNKLAAHIDVTEFLTRLEGIKNPAVERLLATLSSEAIAIGRSDRFSTVAKRAHVTSGSPVISDVRYYRVGLFFRRIRRFDLELQLTEVNGRDVTFDRYEVRVDVWFVEDPWFSSELLNDWKSGTFPLRSDLKVPHESTRSLTIFDNPPICALINDLKDAHDIGMREIAIQARLLGKDDAGNQIEVELKSEPMTWDRFLER